VLPKALRLAPAAPTKERLYVGAGISSNANTWRGDIIPGMSITSPAGISHLKLRHLRLLIALAEEGHLGRAAEKMAMTQPAASRLLSELEFRFGRPLFDRGRHGVRPLSGAKLVIRFARMVCAEEQLVKSGLADDRERPATLRIGTLPTIPAVVIETIRECKRERPTGDIVLREGTIDVLLPWLLDGKLDLVVGRFDPLLAQPPFLYTRLQEEPFSVVAAVAHPLARKRQIRPEDLRRFPWVAPIRGSSLYPHFAELFGGLPLPDDVIECVSPLSVHAFVRDGLRLGLLGASTLPPPLGADLKRLAVVPRSSPGPLGIYQVKGRMVPTEAAMFCAAMLAKA
jgi:DNA-binding transcriptional LysR family regulator